MLPFSSSCRSPISKAFEPDNIFGRHNWVTAKVTDTVTWAVCSAVNRTHRGLFGPVTSKIISSWSECVGPFHGEASFADLRRICWGDAGKLRSDVVDDVEVAVGTIVIAHAEIGADCLSVRGVHLNETREGQEAVEGVVALEARQHNREITVGQRQSKSVPGLSRRN